MTKLTDKIAAQLELRSAKAAQAPAYIAFSTSNTWLSRTIRWFTGGDVTHAVFIAKLPPLDGYWTLGANANGLTWESLDRFQFTGDTIPYIYRADGIWDGIIEYEAWINEPYDYAGLFGMSWVEMIYRLTGKYVLNPTTDRRAIFCSAYATLVLRVKHPEVLGSTDARSVDPFTLKTWCAQDAAFYPGVLEF